MKGSKRQRKVLQAVAIALTGAIGIAAPGAEAAGPPSAPVTADNAPAVPNQLLVGYEAGATPQQRAAARSRAEAHLEERVVPAAADRTEVELVRIPAGADRAAAARRLESDPAVAYAEPNWIYTHATTSDDTYFTDGSLWGMYGDESVPKNDFGSQAAEAWAVGKTGSASVYVGVIDEGIQFDHPDLAGQVWTNPRDPVDGVDNDGNGYVDDIHGWDFEGNNNTIYDGGTKGNLDDHGTHVAGTIGAKMDGKGVVGVSPQVGMISGKFLGRRGGSLANAVKAVDYFTDLKTRHVLNIVATNNSWGGGGFSQALLDAIGRANAAGILFIAAAGNSGSDNDTTASYPSNYEVPNVIAVAAIDSGGGLASFSQYGATTVDLGAPGVGVLSTTAYNTYSSYNGTSMATPHVTGAAALYAAANPGSTSLAIRDAILGKTIPTESLRGKTVTGGRLDATFSGTGPTGGSSGTGGGTTSSPSPTRSVTVKGGTKQGNMTDVTVTWEGFVGADVDVTRSSSTFSTANDGHLVETWRGSGTVTYKVCETGSTTACASGSTTI